MIAFVRPFVRSSVRPSVRPFVRSFVRSLRFDRVLLENGNVISDNTFVFASLFARLIR